MGLGLRLERSTAVGCVLLRMGFACTSHDSWYAHDTRCSVNGNEPHARLPLHSCPQRFVKEMPTSDHLPSHLPRCFWCLATVAGGRPQGPLYFGCAFTLWLVAVAPRARCKPDGLGWLCVCVVAGCGRPKGPPLARRLRFVVRLRCGRMWSPPGARRSPDALGWLCV